MTAGGPQPRRLGFGGFSLIEVLCAILVLGVGMVGLTHGLTTALSSSKESELQTIAALLAAGRIETLRAEGYVTDGFEEGESGEGFSSYHWQQLIRRTDIEGLYEIRVVIQHGRVPQPVYELRTLLFEPPLLPNASPAQNRRETESSRRDRRSR